uniref:Uncharacterized protein n=1 Tax=Anguilla anguilla TaxID=7936 RepID=A0A0E9VW81_ANGAN
MNRFSFTVYIVLNFERDNDFKFFLCLSNTSFTIVMKHCFLCILEIRKQVHS